MVNVFQLIRDHQTRHDLEQNVTRRLLRCEQCGKFINASVPLVILSSGILQWEGPLCGRCLKILAEIVSEVETEEGLKSVANLP